MLLGPGVFTTPYGSGAQAVTVVPATVAGDVLVALYISQVSAGSTPTWAVPVGWTRINGAPNYAIQTPSGLFMNFIWAASIAPGAQPANTAYSFTHGFAGRTIVLLFRAAQALGAALANYVPSASRAAGSFGDGAAASPASVADNFALANPGFDVSVIQGSGSLVAAPSGLLGTVVLVAKMAAGADSLDLAIFVAIPARNVANNATVQSAFTPTPSNNGWAANVFTVQLGVSNTPTTLTFPAGVSSAGAGAMPRRDSRQNPAVLSFGPRTGRHFWG